MKIFVGIFVNTCCKKMNWIVSDTLLFIYVIYRWTIIVHKIGIADSILCPWQFNWKIFFMEVFEAAWALKSSASTPSTGQTMKQTHLRLSRDFISSLRLYRTFYGGLADLLCVSDLSSGDGLACWNGAEFDKGYISQIFCL